MDVHLDDAWAGMKGQGRSMLGNDTEEAMQSEENDYRGSHAGKIET